MKTIFDILSGRISEDSINKASSKNGYGEGVLALAVISTTLLVSLVGTASIGLIVYACDESSKKV